METRFLAIVGHLTCASATYFKRITAKGASGLSREQRVPRLTRPLGKPSPQDRDGAGCEWRDALLSPFTGATDMRTGAELNIGTGQPDQFRRPQSCLGCETEQRRVAPPGPSRPVRGGQQRIDLGLGQPGHQPSLKALRRYCENAFDGGGMFGMAQGCIAEQGTDCGQPGVSGAYPILPFALQMIKEGTDQRRIKIVDVEPYR